MNSITQLSRCSFRRNIACVLANSFNTSASLQAKGRGKSNSNRKNNDDDDCDELPWYCSKKCALECQKKLQEMQKAWAPVANQQGRDQKERDRKNRCSVSTSQKEEKAEDHTTKIIIGVLALAVLAVIAYFILANAEEEEEEGQDGKKGKNGKNNKKGKDSKDGKDGKNDKPKED